MREIKFRAWDKLSNRWQTGFAVTDTGQAVWAGEDCYGGECTPGFEADSDLVVTQYTGLTDKNGKEIYEGDIVKSEFTSVVKWDATLTGFDPFNDYDVDCGQYYDTKSCEVIGNVYQNKDLLK